MWVLVAAFLAYGVDRWLWLVRIDGNDGAILSADFERNPVLSGWKYFGGERGWSAATKAGDRGLAIDQSGKWVSPSAGTDPLQWYRLSFKCRKAGSAENGVRSGAIQCAVMFCDETGTVIQGSVNRAVQASERWERTELRFRAHPALDAAGALRPAVMRVEFTSTEVVPICIDDFLVEKTTASEVGDWSDRFYSKLSARLNYRGKDTRWMRLPGTMEKIRNRQRVRIVFLGDQIQEDLANTPIDVYLQRLYPGCTVEVISSTKAGAGVDYFKDHVADYVTRLRPDLLIVGGTSNPDEMVHFKSLVDEVCSSNVAGRRRTEILLLTNLWNSGATGEEAYRLTSAMRELDQEPEMNAVIPDDYRGNLMQFAKENGVEFLDMMGIISEYVFGSSVGANVGPATDSDGVPYIYWKRDWLYSDGSGKEVMARILEAYFSPMEGDAAAGGMMRDEGKLTPVRMFDPERTADDRDTYSAVRRDFGASAVERPALALRSKAADGARERSAEEATFRVPGQKIRESGYVFDQPLDVRSGDILVYWSFRSDRSAGEEESKLTMHLAFTEPTAGGREDRSQVSLTVRPGAACVLGVGGGIEAQGEVEHLVDAPVENFVDPAKPAKFRLLLRWVGGDSVVVEAASWNSRSRRWEAFIPFDRPGAPPLVMELSTVRNLQGTSSFKSIHFETQSVVAVLESVLVAMRPSMIR